MSSITRAELDAIRQRAEAATEGPWVVCGPNKRIGFSISSNSMKITGEISRTQDRERLLTIGNHAFIAAARTDIPRLLALIDGLAREAQAARECCTLNECSKAIDLIARLAALAPEGEGRKEDR